MSSASDAAKSIVAPLLEKGVKDLIVKKYDPAFDKLQEKIKEKVKPEHVEAVLIAVTEVIQPELKELLLDGADKIDGIEGN